MIYLSHQADIQTSLNTMSQMTSESHMSHKSIKKKIPNQPCRHAKNRQAWIGSLLSLRCLVFHPQVLMCRTALTSAQTRDSCQWFACENHDLGTKTSGPAGGKSCKDALLKDVKSIPASPNYDFTKLYSHLRKTLNTKPPWHLWTTYYTFSIFFHVSTCFNKNRRRLTSGGTWRQPSSCLAWSGRPPVVPWRSWGERKWNDRKDAKRDLDLGIPWSFVGFYREYVWIGNFELLLVFLVFWVWGVIWCFLWGAVDVSWLCVIFRTVSGSFACLGRRLERGNESFEFQTRGTFIGNIFSFNLFLWRNSCVKELFPIQQTTGPISRGMWEQTDPWAVERCEMTCASPEAMGSFGPRLWKNKLLSTCLNFEDVFFMFFLQMSWIELFTY